jgi:nicotinic acid mononucleotide adenylyltransferase
MKMIDAWRARLSQRLAALGPEQEPVVLVACGSFNPPTRAHLRLFPAGAAAVDGAATARDGGDGDDDGNARPPVHRFAVVGGLMSPVGDGYGKAGLAPAAHRLAMCALAAATGQQEGATQQQQTPEVRTRAAAAAAEGVATAPAVDVCVHTWEATRPGFTRTLDVLRQISRELNGGNPREEEDDAREGGGGNKGRGAGGAAAAAAVTATADGGGAGSNEGGRQVRVMLLGGTDLVDSMRRPGVWSEPDVLLREHGVVCVERPAAQEEKQEQEQQAPSAGGSAPSPAPPPPPPALEEALRSCVLHAECDEAIMLGVSSSRARDALREALSAAAAEGGRGGRGGDAGAGSDEAATATRAVAADPRVAELLDPSVVEYAVQHGLYLS